MEFLRAFVRTNSSLGLNTKEFATFEQSVTEINQKINSLYLTRGEQEETCDFFEEGQGHGVDPGCRQRHMGPAALPSGARRPSRPARP
jgi:hypothetical protein